MESKTMEVGAILYWDESAQRLASLATELVRPIVRSYGSGTSLTTKASMSPARLV